jgi:NADH dehydrogenase (ubiquinone) 1 alpha subcomplex subunit 9
MSRRLFTRNMNGELSNSFKHKQAESNMMGVTSVTFGCTGFFGRYLHGCTSLHNFTNIVPYRHRSGAAGGHVRAQRMIGDGTYGQQFVTDYELDKEFLVKAMLEKTETVFNAVGMWQEPCMYENSQSWFDMEAVNVEWPRLLAKWSREMGINRLVHISHVNADPASKSKLLAQKGRAELAVLEEFPRATIVRSTEMFGEDDNNFTKYLRTQRWSRVHPMVNYGEKIVQPVFAADVAEAMVRCAMLDHTQGRIAELGGPVRFTMNDFVRYCAQCIGNYHFTVNLPNPAWRALVAFNESNIIKKGALFGGRHAFWNREWLERQYIDDCAMPERDPNLLDWEDLGISKDDLYRVEDRFFHITGYWSKDNPYVEHGIHL